jgi:type I restriction enzyme S subunit
VVNLSLEWESKSFSDLVDIIGGGTPKTSIDEYWNGDIPWISIKDFNSGQKYVLSTEKTITELGLNNSSTKLLHKDDIIISARGTVGEVAMIKYEMAFNQSCYGLKVHELLDKDFVYYLLRYNINKLRNMVHGAVFDTITTNTFDNIIVNVPPQEYQEKISYLLSNIDNLIEVKIHENKNLQKQINILFKSFFINFEFYDGKYQETLFGEIPIEWNIILFKDILNERNEKSTNQDIPMYSVTLDGIQPRADIYKKKITAKTTKFKIIHKYDLIFGMPNSGYQYGIMYDEIGGVSSAYPVFEINGIQPRYVDLFIKNISNYFNDIVKSGSRMGQGIDKKVLLSKEIYVPPNEHLDKYYSIESKLLDLINHNLTEINNLTKLRDTLLPKLMSGEIDVSKINCDLKIIIRKIYIKSSKLFLWRYLSENQNHIKNTKSNETLLKSRAIHKINKFLAKFNARYRYYRQ